MDCIFCQIVSGKIPSDVIYQDEEVIAFRDINPQCPVHILVIPREHFTSLIDITSHEASLMGHMISLANQLARDEAISDSGYRLVINCGKQGGQLVPHLHLHLLGGRQLSGQLG
ncbi:MAG: histidine triad nucleotide-binding protein [Dehalococcoidia bacterium]|nr:MAG: histidine triad nucleotide-binding protein [Dehalococcoidia bacterium]